MEPSGKSPTFPTLNFCPKAPAFCGRKKKPKPPSISSVNMPEAPRKAPLRKSLRERRTPFRGTMGERCSISKIPPVLVSGRHFPGPEEVHAWTPKGCAYYGKHEISGNKAEEKGHQLLPAVDRAPEGFHQVQEQGRKAHHDGQWYDALNHERGYPHGA